MGKFSESRDAILGTGTSKDAKCIPTRYVMTVTLFFGCFIIFSLRVNLNIAIVAMVNSSRSNNGNESALPAYCSLEDAGDDTGNSTSPLSEKAEGPFDWSLSEQAIILGGFYYGFAATQIVGSRAAAIFGPRKAFGVGLFTASALTLLTPLAAQWHLIALVSLRVLIGIAQGFTFASIFTLVPVWYLPHETSSQLSTIVTGNLVGNVAAMPLTGFLCEQVDFLGGWPSAFYLFGAVGCLYSIAFFFLVYDHPSKHPRISAKELKLLTEGRESTGKNSERPAVPWKSILTSGPFWAFTLARTTVGYAFHVVLSRIPTYLASILDYPIGSNGLMNSLMYACQGVAVLLSGYISAYIKKNKLLRLNLNRKLFETGALLGTSAMLCILPEMGCNKEAAIAVLCMSLTFLSLNAGGDMALPTEMAPAFSGTIFGISNTISGSSGFVAPLVVSALLKEDASSLLNWKMVFYCSSGVCLVGALGFIFFGSAELQPWALDKKSKEADKPAPNEITKF